MHIRCIHIFCTPDDTLFFSSAYPSHLAIYVEYFPASECSVLPQFFKQLLAFHLTSPLLVTSTVLTESLCLYIFTFYVCVIITFVSCPAKFKILIVLLFIEQKCQFLICIIIKLPCVFLVKLFTI